MPIDLFAGLPITDYPAGPSGASGFRRAAVWFLRRRSRSGMGACGPPIRLYRAATRAPGRAVRANGVRKVTFRDAEGNEFSFGGARCEGDDATREW